MAYVIINENIKYYAKKIILGNSLTSLNTYGFYNGSSVNRNKMAIPITYDENITTDGVAIFNESEITNGYHTILTLYDSQLLELYVNGSTRRIYINNNGSRTLLYPSSTNIGWPITHFGLFLAVSSDAYNNTQVWIYALENTDSTLSYADVVTLAYNGILGVAGSTVNGVLISTANIACNWRLIGGLTLEYYTTDYFSYSEEVPADDDPYSGAGDSDTGGGDGTFDGSSDPVPVPSLPSIGATDTGFISLFVPSASQIRQVASYLWSNFFDLATFKKLFEDPMECILGLSVVPVSVPTSGSAQITVGNIELSGISLPLASQQYVEIDCGTVNFTRRYFGSYLDFEPYTKMSLFVPYSGVHAICADDVIGKVVGLKYHIDILTGSLVAFLTCGNSVLYEFNGACASNIPVNSMNYASTIENSIRIAVNIGTTVATAGAAAPATAAGEGAKLAVSGAEVGRAIALGGSTAQGALSLKPSIDRAGSLGGTTGLMGNQIPYFIITRPRMCKPKNQDVFQGYPSFIQTTLGDMEGTGFTAFENVILAGSYLTDTEKSELESILSAGVYL